MTRHNGKKALRLSWDAPGELKACDEELSALLEAAHEAFLTVDGKGVILRANRAAETLFGYAPGELIGAPFTRLWAPTLSGPKENRSFQDFLIPFFQNPETESIEMAFRRKDSGEVAADVSLARWKKGGKEHYSLVLQDAAARGSFNQALVENEHRLFEFLEIIPVGIFIVNEKGQPYYCNQAAKEILGQGIRTLSLGELSQAYGFYQTGADKPYSVEKLPLVRALRGEKFKVEDLEIRRGEKTIPLEVWVAPIFGKKGEIKFAMAAFTDVTERKAAERSLQSSEEKFRAVTETATDAVILSNSRGGIIYYNKGAEKIFGYSQEEILGKPFVKLLPDRLHKLYGEGTGRLGGISNVENSSYRTDLTGRRKDGSEVPLEVSSSFWRTEEGIFMTRIMCDVTDRKQAIRMLQEREEAFRNIFEEGPVGMALTDPQSRIVNVNHAFCQMLGYRKKELVGRPFFDFLEPGDGLTDLGLAEKLFSGLIPHYQMEERHVAKDGKTFWCKLTASVILDVDQKPLHRLAIVENIDEIKQIEEMKKDLIAVVSHQLKTPVAEINGYIEIMLDGLAGQLNPQQTEYLTDMRNIGRDNYRLISDLLNVSKLERGVISVDIQKVDLRDIVNLSIRDYDQPIRAKGLHLYLRGMDQALVVNADREKTVETLRNLINNATKCTDKGWIAIEIQSNEKEGTILVEDTGIGMGPETMGRLFTKSRVMGKEASRAGAGLGLFIAKRFMQLQQGDIEVSSELGKGTRFYLRLPKPVLSEDSHG
jgi:PAS domain S-box-containing protein